MQPLIITATPISPGSTRRWTIRAPQAIAEEAVLCQQITAAILHNKRWPRPHLFVTSAISSLRQIDENDVATRHGSIQSLFKI